ncbi:putative Exocyst complex component [Hibiscus syriacus]|uniref:Exocyst complex component n=1 Tax=Hibiscus syriacus TaxID=106335 RepID=A0A6A3AKR3_HIBSY|nr:putative Exocyst complex component [Hibiscus syriacus]
MERTLWRRLPLLVRANSKESVEFILQTLWRTRKSGLDADDRRLLCEMLQLQNESDLDPFVKSVSGFSSGCCGLEMDFNMQITSSVLIVKCWKLPPWLFLDFSFPGVYLIKLFVSLGYSTDIMDFRINWCNTLRKIDSDIGFICLSFIFKTAVPDLLLLCLRVLIRKCVYENISKDDIQKVFPEEVLPELQRLLTLLLQKFQREWQADIHMDKVSLPFLKAMTWNTATQETEMMEPLAVINLKLQNDAQAPQEELDLKFQLAKGTLDTMLKSMYCIRDQLSNLVGAMAQLSILVPVHILCSLPMISRKMLQANN